MLYYVTFEDRPDRRRFVVDLVELPNGTFEAKVDGLPISVDIAERGARICARIDGHILDVVTEGRPPRLEMSGRGIRLAARVESERDASTETRRPTRADGPKVIKSPMPGRVVRVLVTPGDSVRAGQGLLVLEAMKMENEVRAVQAALVVEVHVVAGTAVDANTKLVTLSLLP